MLIPRLETVDDGNGVWWKKPAWRGYQFIIAEWVGFGICTVFVALRLYTQWPVITKRPWGEVFIMVAYVFFFANCLLYTLQVRLHYWDFAPREFVDSHRPDLILAGKLALANGVFYLNLIYACKASFLCFYSEIAPKHCFPKIRIMIIVTWVLLVIGVVGQVLWNFLSCLPLSRNWDLMTTEDEYCYNSPVRMWFIWSWHMATDLIVYIIPLLIVRSLTIDRQKKIEVTLLFCAGFINIVLACLTMAIFTLGSLDPHKGFWGIGIFLFTNLCQQVTAIMMACAPYVRKFIRDFNSRKISRVKKRINFWKGSVTVSTTASSGVVEMSRTRPARRMSASPDHSSTIIEDESGAHGDEEELKKSQPSQTIQVQKIQEAV